MTASDILTYSAQQQRTYENSAEARRVTQVDSSGTVTIYDNTAASGTVIATIDTIKALGSLEFDIPFSTGLTVVTATGAKVVVIYE